MRSSPDRAGGALWRAGLRVLAFALLAGACGGTASGRPTAGSESHFLAGCVSSCDDGLSCIGGICTRACLLGSDECGALAAGAVCTDASVEPGQVAVCDLACSGQGSCAALGDGYACEASFCRASAAAPPATSVPPPPGEVSCEPYRDEIPPPDERGLSIVNVSNQVLYLQQRAQCGGDSRSTLVGVARGNQTVNTLGGGCARGCQESVDEGWDARFEGGPTSPDCPGIDCAALPRIAIQPGETLFQPSLPEIVFRRMPGACADNTDYETVNCYARVIPQPGDYTLTVVAFTDPDCESTIGCGPFMFSLPTTTPLQNQTLELSVPTN